MHTLCVVQEALWFHRMCRQSINHRLFLLNLQEVASTHNIHSCSSYTESIRFYNTILQLSNVICIYMYDSSYYNFLLSLLGS